MLRNYQGSRMIGGLGWKVLGAGALLALGTGLVGCSDRAEPTAVTEAAPGAVTEAVTPPDAPLVVATSGVICDLTQQIAETTVALTCLIQPGQDPHTYQVRPSDRQAIEQADLILYDGYGAAPSIIDMVENATTAAPRIAVYETAVPTPLMGEPHDHDHGHDDHDHGHDHGHDHDSHSAGADLVPDPHVWHSARNNGAIAAVIATQLKELNPDHADLYADNAAQLTEEFAQIDDWILVQVATIPVGQRKLVTTHDSFRYFADAYGLEVKGALSGLSTEARPTPGALTALVDQVKAAEVPAIFAETTTNPQLIATVANDAGVSVADQPLFVEGPGGPGTAAPTTQAMLIVNTCTVVDALGGRCDMTGTPDIES